MSYYDFSNSIRFSLYWNSLKYKYENKIESSEFYFYNYLSDQVALVALNLGFDYNLCESLVKVHSFSFCNYGYAGWKAIMAFFDSINIKVNLNQLQLALVKVGVSRIKTKPDDKFYEYLFDMYSDSPKTKEVKLVLECHRIAKNLQPLKNTNISLYYSLIEKAITEVKNKYLECNDIIQAELSEYIPVDMMLLDNSINDEIKHYYFELLKDYIKVSNLNYYDYPMDNDFINSVSCVIHS